MESLVSQLLSFPPAPTPPEPEYDKLIKGVVKLLNNTSGSKLKTGVGGTSLFEVFDPSINSIPYLYTLLAYVQAPNELMPGSRIWENASKFLHSFDPIQIRYAGHEWRRLMDDFARGAEMKGDVDAAIEPMRASLLRLDPHTSTLTSCHVTFFRLCLLARAFDSAVSVLEGDIFHFPTSDKAALLPLPCSQHTTSSTYMTNNSGFSTKLDYAEPLLYHLYGGMVYLGTKDWGRASRFFELVMTHVTAQAPSLIQVEAYKKWILANLLRSGTVPSMPRGTSSLAMKHYRALGKPYEVLGEAFKEPDPARLKAEIEVGQSVWQPDGNMSLVLQILAAHQRFAILSLSKTYTSLPLLVVAQLPVLARASPSDVQVYINNLITMGQLSAVLTPASDPSESILRFQHSLSVDGSGNETQTESKLLKAKDRIEALDQHMQISQRRMELTKEYVEAERKVRRNKAEGSETTNGHDGFSQSHLMDYQEEEILEEL